MSVLGLEGERLLDQCIFSVKSLQSRGATIKASVKELQSLRTSRNIILFGVPSNVHYAAITKLMHSAMGGGTGYDGCG